MKKAVFLDRDGTVIIDKIYLNDPDQIEYFPHAEEAIQSLCRAGFLICIATNQSGIPRGLVQIENLDEIHRRISVHLKKWDIEIAGYYYAPHLPNSDHELRKPNPGMLLLGAEEHNIDLSKSWMIGDRMTDVEAGRRAGTKTIFLEGTEDPNESEFKKPDFIFPSLKEAVEQILLPES